MKGSLVNGAIPEITQAGTLFPLVFQSIGNPGTKRCLTGHNPVTSPVVFIRREKVHRTTFSLGAPRLLTVELSHAFVHRHSNAKGMTMIPICSDDVIILSQDRDRSAGDRFLPDVEMEKSPHLFILVLLERDLFESSDPNHLAKQFDLVLIGELLVNIVIGKGT